MMLSNPSGGPVRIMGVARWLIPLGAVLAAQLLATTPSQAVIEPIYTLPFFHTYSIG